MRRLGRQESPLSRDTLLTGREKDTQTTAPESAGSQTESPASKAESKTSAVDTSKTLPPAEVAKSSRCAAAVEIKSNASSSETKPGSGNKAPGSSVSGPEATISKSKLSEKISAPGTSRGLQKQDTKQQSAQTDSGPAAKAQEKTEEKAKGTAGAHKGNLQKASSTEQSKQRKGTDTVEKGGLSGSDKASDTTKIKGPTPPVLSQVQTYAAARCKEEKPTSRGIKEEKAHLEVLDEIPMPLSSPGSSKSRPMSPGDKASFVTQLTSVAKTVLGPMKGASQDGGKVKDTFKSSEEKRGSSVGKAEASSGGVRRGAQTAASAGAVQSDKGNIRSSKHHL